MCKWSVDLGSGAPLLLLAGQKGLIRVLDCGRGALVHVRGVGGGEHTLLLLAGQKGLIRVLDCGRGALVHVRGGRIFRLFVADIR